jgi:hypothetical protein
LTAGLVEVGKLTWQLHGSWQHLPFQRQHVAARLQHKRVVCVQPYLLVVQLQVPWVLALQECRQQQSSAGATELDRTIAVEDNVQNVMRIEHWHASCMVCDALKLTAQAFTKWRCQAHSCSNCLMESPASAASIV